MIPDDSLSSHQVVADDQCNSCHDPHSADYKFNLTMGGNKLCFKCHQEMEVAVTNLKTPHAPVASNCLKCHNPHSSSSGRFLLIDDSPDLCKKCHKTTGKQFDAQHMNYPVSSADCTSCHNPHGSNQQSMLYDNVHSPVAKRMCNQCHEDSTSAEPLKVQRVGFQLCRGCHSDTVNDAFGKKQLHWPLAGKRGCLECHSPHASKEKNLLPGSQISVCGRCHDDTIQRHQQSKAKHEPVVTGECTTCHSPHASDYKFLTMEQSVINVCGNCHDWQTHSTHPIGKDYTDLRNPNMSIDCLSCHRSHGTEYEHLMPFTTISALCVQCHESFKR
jgi:predicted CXXCH cytochrome family protein